ncbi:MAG: universal stress protein [Cytophagales bacterium]|nr:universal stress protein [Rhizobacter sp.]
MNYRTLLVHLDGDAGCAARVALALQMAARHDAHLVGLAATGALHLPVVVEADMRGWTDVVERSRSHQFDRAQACVNAFQVQADASGLKSFEGVLAQEEAEAAMVRHGRLSDLLILSQADAHDEGATVATDFPQRVFMQTGRPVLMLPRVGSVAEFGRTVLVSWSGTRESARALNDALPLLRMATKVSLLCLDRPDEAVVSRLELNDLRHWLERHGINSECVQISTREDVGDALLLRAQGLGADLIVMGGFGHSRWAELVLGGVTRTVLGTAVVPVLISH